MLAGGPLPDKLTVVRVFAFLNVDDPWVAWLVYRGEVVSSEAAGEQVLSLWHAKYLFDAQGPKERAEYYKAELSIEQERASSYPDRVSRLSGLYFFKDAESARRAGRRWDGNFRDEHLAEIELVGHPRVSKHDSEWITHFMSSPDQSWIPNYLAGHAFGPRPLWELLVQGRGFVLGTRVRERAYESVKRAWPRSLGLLKLSRVAVELGSDLGFIAPLLTVDGNLARLKVCLNFEDARNPEFLTRLGAHKGPKNTADLNQHTDLVLPDLSGYRAEFRI